MPKPYIIAEIASAHEGSPAFAKRLFGLSASTGADAVKFQIFRRDSLISRFHAKYNAFGLIEIAPEAWLDILAECSGAGVDIVVEVYDHKSLEVSECSGVVKAYKVPTSDIGNMDLLSLVAKTGKRVMLAVGGATSDEIRAAVDQVRPLMASGNLVLMHGFQSFPTLIADTNLERLRWMAQTFNLPVGYADHVDADQLEMARVVPAMALAAGASIIEKHITDDRSRKGRDYYSSLNPGEFSDFVKFIREAGIAVGEADPALTKAEVDYRYLMKKQAVAQRELAAGDIVKSGDVAFRRTGIDGMAPSAMAKLYGRAMKVARRQDEPISASDIE